MKNSEDVDPVLFSKEANQTQNPVQQHAACFANAKGVLTYEHMNDVQEEVHSTGYFKSLFASDAIMSMLDERQLPHTAEGVTRVGNPAASGLWTQEGELNEELFALLKDKYTVDVNGTSVVTKDNFYKFVKEAHADDNDEKKRTIDSTAGHARLIQPGYCFASYTEWLTVPITWQEVTDASIDRLFDDFHNVSEDTLHRNNLTGPALTYERLRLFYEDSATFFELYKDKPSEANPHIKMS